MHNRIGKTRLSRPSTGEKADAHGFQVGILLGDLGRLGYFPLLGG